MTCGLGAGSDHLIGEQAALESIDEIMSELGDINIRIPSDDTQRIQEGHLMVEHILCEYVEASTV